MKEDNGKIVAATENGIFYYTISTGEITKLSKANGLHNIGITAFDYNPKTKMGLIGYENGSWMLSLRRRSSMLSIFLLLQAIVEDKKSTIFRSTEIRL
jgi:ligand-binding sensor domain-containing protein